MPPTKHARTEDGALASSSSPSRAASCSVNPIFACSGPRAGLLSYARGKRAVDELLDVVDDSILRVLDDAWDGVGVPAADYWRARPQQAITVAATPLTSGIAELPEVRVPDPASLLESFYGSRLAALRGRGYRTNGGLAVLAVDRRAGNGSKLFTVLPRDSIADFVNAIPHRYDRNLYALVDEQAPVDPYFDVDCSYVAPSAAGARRGTAAAATALAEAFPWWTESSSGVAGDSSVEELLYTVITFLQRYIEKHLGTRIEQCLVLTSCLRVACDVGEGRTPAEGLLEVKLSFHVHFRLHERHAIASVRDMHLFMAQLRDRLDAVLLQKQNTPVQPADIPAAFVGVAASPADLATAASMVRKCIDFGVYTRWRAFRLPYNVKTPFATAAGPAAAFTPVDAAVEDLLTGQLEQCGAVAEVPDVSVGAAATSLVHSVVLSADPAVQAAQRGLVTKMSYLLRFLLPVVAGVTRLHHGPLNTFLEAYAPRVALPAATAANHKLSFGAAVMGLAAIQRDDGPPQQEQGQDGEAGGTATTDRLRLLRFPGAVGAAAAAVPGGESSPSSTSPSATGTSTADTRSHEGPFAEKMPPRPHSTRVIVTDPSIKNLLAEVFACLAPQFAGVDPGAATTALPQRTKDFPLPSVSVNQRVTGDRLQAQYEESLRAYYVLQKQNKYCLRLGRVHKSTYAQLYLTYGSIKVRCYANDCCERCLFIPWSEPSVPAGGGHFAPGYPKYDRLTAIHHQLFPPLPLDELVRRYGPAVLSRASDQVPQQRQQQQQTATIA